MRSQQRNLWAAAIAFAAGVVIHLLSPLHMAAWSVAMATGVTLVLFGLAVLRVGMSEPSARALQAGLIAVYLGLAGLVNSWWPIVTLVPTIGGLARWQAMDDASVRPKRAD
ncbi:hypothetical protein HQ535_02170 [bacterium]|nr:hypothetical protein [bacterium]